MPNNIIMLEALQSFEHGLQIAFICLAYGFILVEVGKIEIHAIYKVLRGNDKVKIVLREEFLVSRNGVVVDAQLNSLFYWDGRVCIHEPRILQIIALHIDIAKIALGFIVICQADFLHSHFHRLVDNARKTLGRIRIWRKKRVQVIIKQHKLPPISNYLNFRRYSTMIGRAREGAKRSFSKISHVFIIFTQF